MPTIFFTEGEGSARDAEPPDQWRSAERKILSSNRGSRFFHRISFRPDRVLSQTMVLQEPPSCSLAMNGEMGPPGCPDCSVCSDCFHRKHVWQIADCLDGQPRWGGWPIDFGWS